MRKSAWFKAFVAIVALLLALPAVAAAQSQNPTRAF